MFVKLQNNYINLDLIFKVSDVKAYHVHNLDYNERNISYFYEIGSNAEEAAILHRIAVGSEYQREFLVAYGFEINYIGKESSEKIIVGTDRIEARKFLEAFMDYLNSNISSVPEIKIK